MSAVEGRARLGLVGHAESAQEPRQRRQLTEGHGITRDGS